MDLNKVPGVNFVIEEWCIPELILAGVLELESDGV